MPVGATAVQNSLLVFIRTHVAIFTDNAGDIALNIDILSHLWLLYEILVPSFTFLVNTIGV